MRFVQALELPMPFRKRATTRDCPYAIRVIHLYPRDDLPYPKPLHCLNTIRRIVIHEMEEIMIDIILCRLRGHDPRAGKTVGGVYVCYLLDRWDHFPAAAGVSLHRVT